MSSDQESPDPAGRQTPGPDEAVLAELVEAEGGRGVEVLPTPAVSSARAPYPSLGTAVLLILLTILLQVLFGIVFAVACGVLRELGLRTDGGTLMAIGMGLINAASMGLVIALGLFRSRRPVRDVLPLGPFPAMLLIPLAVAAAGLTILVSECDNAIRSAVPIPDLLVDYLRHVSEGGLAWAFLLVIVAPLTEELLFRGVFLSGFLLRYGTSRSIVYSAVLFALCHVNPCQYAVGVIMGLLLGWLYVRCRSLWPCMVTHAFVNGIVWLLPTLRDVFGLHVRGFTGPIGASAAQFQPLWFDAIGLVLTALGIWGIAVLTQDRNRPAATQ